MCDPDLCKEFGSTRRIPLLYVESEGWDEEKRVSRRRELCKTQPQGPVTAERRLSVLAVVIVVLHNTQPDCTVTHQ